ncbi:MAG TPA: DUF1236 domain-containing protein [Ensifer sp.]|jgi:hypothetical protein|nr:DUF1236 domain-containing protein [Ensifer sp.]
MRRACSKESHENAEPWIGRRSCIVRQHSCFGSSQRQVTIGQPEQTRIREYVVKEKGQPIMIKEKVTVGATLPVDAELHAAPNDWGPSVSKYSYVYTDSHVVLVEPSRCSHNRMIKWQAPGTGVCCSQAAGPISQWINIHAAGRNLANA